MGVLRITDFPYFLPRLIAIAHNMYTRMVVATASGNPVVYGGKGLGPDASASALELMPSLQTRQIAPNS